MPPTAAPIAAALPAAASPPADAFWSSPVRSTFATPEGAIDAGEVERRVERRAAEIGPGRLVLADGDGVELAVTLLACLRVGSPVIVTGTAGGRPSPGPAHDRLLDRFDPDVVVGATAGGATIEHRHDAPAHDLHPDLALLLSTSGSTGSPKLVRLSARNVAANATAIARSLDLRPDDCGVTSLPLHYCYGLSVLTSHLAVGAKVAFTRLSVVDRCFWAAVREEGVTTLSGVPYTFEQLDHVGMDGLDAGGLRRLTQAGGRMHPSDVRRWADRAAASGIDFYVMYGQTEATARMAVLPPALAAGHPDAVGVAVPGGEIHVRPFDEPRAGVGADRPPWPADSGEIVYRGPNVMMGYATDPAHLARPSEVDELRTGDVGVLRDGLLHIVGRTARFAKVGGLRIDLDAVETSLADRGILAAVDGDDRLVVGAVDRSAAVVRHHLGEVVPLPDTHVDVVELERLPRLPSGKIDRAAVVAVADARRSSTAPPPSSVGDVYREVIGVATVGPDDTFVGLGGDSLSYVETSVRLEGLLGRVPPSWHTMTVAELDAAAGPVSRRLVRLETPLVLRAVAIVLIVGNHMGAFLLQGGAHVLLAAAGFNMARFQLEAPPGDHTRRWARVVGRIALPTAAWVTVGLLALDRYTVPAALLVNNQFGEATPERLAWRFWFVEALVQCLVVAALVTAVPAVRRFERRWPFGLAIGAAAVAVAARFAAYEPDRLYMLRTERVAWMFVLGWAAQRARTVPQRVAVSALALVGCHDFFRLEHRNVVLALGLLLLVWAPVVVMPRWVGRLVAPLAAASLGIYLVHADVYPAVQRWLPNDALALTATLAACVAIHAAASAGWRRVRQTGATAGRNAAARVAVTRTRSPALHRSSSAPDLTV